MKSHRIVHVLGASLRAALCLAVASAGASCSKSASPADRPRGGPPAVKVSVAPVEQRLVPQEFTGPGTVVASASVSVRSEVGGLLTKVHIRAGQEVRKGDVLFTIDPRSYQAALQQAQATLARDQFQAENARIELQREANLLESKISSPADYDRKKTDAEALAAVVQADQAAVDIARLQLERCTIRSPLDGRAGQLLVDQGNVVKANDAPLLTINQIRPIDVSFAVPQQYLPLVKARMAEGKLVVRAAPPREEGPVQIGELTFVDNAVDRSTGTIQLKATFPNESERLWPGQYVEVALILSTDPNALVVPSAAVQVGRDGRYVYVVREDPARGGLVAEYRPVTVRQADAAIAVIDRGLAPGEIVVTDGHMRLAPGASVEVRPEVGASSSASQTAPARTQAQTRASAEPRAGGTPPGRAGKPDGPPTGMPATRAGGTPLPQGGRP